MDGEFYASCMDFQHHRTDSKIYCDIHKNRERAVGRFATPLFDRKWRSRASIKSRYCGLQITRTNGGAILWEAEDDVGRIGEL